MQSITIDYFTDMLCIWAYVAQIRIDELEQEFGSQINVVPRYFPVFGHTMKKMETQWQTKGGIQGYASHVQGVVKAFDHVQLHPDVWIKNTPTSSLPAHLYLSAVKCLEQQNGCAEGSVEKMAWAMREAFFRSAQDISSTQVLKTIISDNGIDIGQVCTRIENGEAFAVLSEDMKIAMELNVKSSPTMIFNEDRQRLTGNVGYKIMQANIRELLNSPNKQHSWC